MSWGVSPWVYPIWNSLCFLDLGDYFLPHFREVFNYYLLKYFLMAFLSSSSNHRDSYDLNVGAFNPFTFKVIIDKYDPVAIYFIVLRLGLYTPFLCFLSREYPLTFIGELVWWC